MDIRECTGIIIEKDGEFLVGTILFSKELRWSTSPYDAWFTRRKDKAFIVADKVNGRRFLFNPVVGKIRSMENG